MFKRIKAYFFNKKFMNCYEEIKFNRQFYTSNVLSPNGIFKNYPLDTKFKVYEEEILIHMPYEAYSIYNEKYGNAFMEYLVKDAFGTDSILNEHVKDCFIENCMKARS